IGWRLRLHLPGQNKRTKYSAPAAPAVPPETKNLEREIRAVSIDEERDLTSAVDAGRRRVPFNPVPLRGLRQLPRRRSLLLVLKRNDAAGKWLSQQFSNMECR